MTGYTYLQALEASTQYFNGDELAAKVFVDKYALKNERDEYLELTPTDMHHRLAKELARIEAKYPNPMSEEEIFELLERFKYVILQGSPMSAIGNPYKLQSCGNCFVIESPYDSYGGICKADQELVQLMKRRAGCGLDLSNIRPKGAPTDNAASTTDGIGIFMERFSNTCREVAQGGRRGAEMQSIAIEHPEVETFITIKQDRTKVTGANVSVRISDDFMKAVKTDTKFLLKWPVDSDKPTITKEIRARDLWEKIIECAWNSAEPGIFFWSNVLKNSPADIYGSVNPLFRSISSNPCGEIIMGVDSCRLTVVNLFAFVNNPFRSSARFDFNHFQEVVIKAQRIMDDIIDLELEQIDKIIAKVKKDPEPIEIKRVELDLWARFRKTCELGRRTGLGITALGDCLAALGIKYGSDKAIKKTEAIYKALAIGAYKSSCTMAGERGSFPLFDRKLEEDHPFVARIIHSDEELLKLYNKHGRRNIALTTTAPTGSVSTLTQTSSGIEPVFLLSYTRRKKINPSDKEARVDFVDALGDKWQEFVVYHHGVKQWIDITGETDITKSPYWEATSNEIDWVASVEMQAVAQRWVCHSISKTCNLPKDVSKEVVAQVYMKAWETGCKGFTVYRDGCRDGVLLSKDKTSPDDRPDEIITAHAPKRPLELSCEIKKVKVQGEAWTIFMGMLNGRPYEIFGGLSKYVDIPNKYKTGKIVKNGKIDGIATYNLFLGEGEDEMVIKDLVKVFENPNFGTFTRTISLALRHGAPVQYIVEQLQKDKHSDMTSFSKVIARVLKSYISDGTQATGDKTCSSCKQTGSLVYQEGCLVCKNCGWSRC
jgi:ribonucleoside-diphosphate reductase alpha chain